MTLSTKQDIEREIARQSVNLVKHSINLANNPDLLDMTYLYRLRIDDLYDMLHTVTNPVDR